MVCLDTDIIIDFLKGNLDKRYEFVFSNYSLSICAPNVMEIIKGLHLKKNKKQVTKHEIDKIKSILSSMQIIPFDKESAILAGEIEAKLINEGEMIDVEDIIVGAICIKNNEKLVTKNIKHFKKMEKFGLRIYGYSFISS
jgi:tRNA(fMet)-specific endonuclease VapC